MMKGKEGRVKQKLGKTKEKGGKTKEKGGKTKEKGKKEYRAVWPPGAPVSCSYCCHLSHLSTGSRQPAEKRKEHSNSLISRSQFVNYHL